eukprot:jgi/Tetstr1/440505/TSEL_028828.t1
MADQAATAAAAAADLVNMEIDTHVARVIQVELAKTKTRVPATDIINASRILGDRREFPPESDAGMAYRGLLADNPPVPRDVAPGVSVVTVFADIDDFQSKLVACFHSNSNLPGVIMRYATGLRIAPNHPHLPGNTIKLAQHLRRTFDLLPEHLRYNEFTVVGVIQACLPNSAQIALEAAGRRANEPIDSYATICRHLEAIDLEFAASASSKRKCDGCGRLGHSIMKCSSTSEADKQAWRQTVAANKAAKGITKLNLNRPDGQ